MTPFFAGSPSASAGFLSSILGEEDRVAGGEVLESETLHTNQNSQTMALLKADISYLSPKNSKKAQKEELEAGSTIAIISGNALVPSAGLQSISEGVGDGRLSFDQMSVYVVRKGDTISHIAEMFDVSTNTILWANDLKKNQKLSVGDTLFILPVSGVQHTVKKGQTLGGIAKLYKVTTSEIIDFNGLADGTKLAIGDELIIPDGIMIDGGSSSTRTTTKSSQPSYYSTSKLKNLAGYFINPVPDLKRKSQGLHGPGNRGIDLAAPTGTNIYASAPGKVILARSGYNGGYGNMVIIQHPNDTKTLYAHMSKIKTNSGVNVERGEVIGLIGSTGRSTGPHLHFEVFNAKNPGADWSWAN